ncbi:MAG: hypothetical protein FD174_2577 [Geobacteraceae bacterium]|nr:MAG: hypothetical protein FD174_2577 [Geobacteraceae bacterium]
MTETAQVQEQQAIKPVKKTGFKKPAKKKPAPRPEKRLVTIPSASPAPPRQKEVSEAEAESRLLDETKKILDSQPKVKILIASTETQKDDVTVSIQGYTYLIQRDKEVEVPQSVAKVLQDAILTAYSQQRREDGEGNELVAREVNRFPFQVRI